MMTELTFIGLDTDTCGSRGGRLKSPAAGETHCHRAARRTGGIFHLLGLERKSFHCAARRAFPYIIIHCLQSLLEILGRSEKCIILLFIQATHLMSAIRAFTLASADGSVEPKRKDEENQSGTQGEKGAPEICGQMASPEHRLLIAIQTAPIIKVAAEAEEREKEETPSHNPHETPDGIGGDGLHRPFIIIGIAAAQFISHSRICHGTDNHRCGAIHRRIDIIIPHCGNNLLSDYVFARNVGENPLYAVAGLDSCLT